MSKELFMTFLYQSGTVFGISSDGSTLANARTVTVKLVRTKDYPWGKVRYYSDGSAEVINSKMDVFVRNADDIKDNWDKYKELFARLADASFGLEDYFGAPQDIEGGIKNGKIYLWQTRNIT